MRGPPWINFDFWTALWFIRLASDVIINVYYNPWIADFHVLSVQETVQQAGRPFLLGAGRLTHSRIYLLH